MTWYTKDEVSPRQSKAEGDILSPGREIRKPRTCSGSWSIEPRERKVIDEVSEVGWLTGEGFEHEAEDAGLVPWHW